MDDPENRADEQPAAAPQPPPVDVAELAERVYRLLLAELRLERARGAAGSRREAR